MKPVHHLIVSIILAIVLFPFFEWLALLVFVFGFLIDFDHYVYFAIKEGRLNPIKTYKFLIKCMETHDYSKLRKDELHILHTAEACVLITVASFFLGTAGIILFIGLAVHVVMDFIWGLMLESKGIDIKGIRANSLLAWIARRLKKQKT